MAIEKLHYMPFHRLPISLVFTILYCLAASRTFARKMKAHFIAQRQHIYHCKTKMGTGFTQKLSPSNGGTIAIFVEKPNPVKEKDSDEAKR